MAYVEAPCNEVRRGFGSIEGCIADALGIGAETRQTR